MQRLYREGGEIEVYGMKMDHKIFDDSEVETAIKDGWASAHEIYQRSKSEQAFDDADTNDSGKLSVDEIRDAAKQAGIENWEGKRIKTLKRELGLDGNQS